MRLFILLSCVLLSGTMSTVVDVDDVKNSYDFIVIGLGTSGPVILNRLHEMGAKNILGIEGGGDWSNTTLTLSKTQWGSWNYYADRDTRRPGSYKAEIVQGRTTGGSMRLSNNGWERGIPVWHNTMANIVRDERYNYTVAKCFYENVIERDINTTRGKIQVRQSNSNTILGDAWKTIGLNMGYKVYNDCRYIDSNDNSFCYESSALKWTSNGGLPIGRSSTSWEEYGREIEDDKGVDIILNSRVVKLLTKYKRGVKSIIGVRVIVNGEYTMDIKAKKATILASGTLGNINILSASGIGNRTVLESAGIQVFNELPAVGFNFQDTGTLTVGYSSNFSINDINTPGSVLLNTKLAAFIKTVYSTRSAPDFLLIGILSTGSITFIQYDLDRNNSGRVYPITYDPLVRSNVETNYLGSNLEINRKATFYNITRSIVEKLRQQLPQFYFTERAPTSGVYSLSDLTTLMLQHPTNGGINPSGHFSGTCRMGPYGDVLNSVVNPDLQVHDIDSLYIADNSVYPIYPGSGGIAPGVLIGERMSQILSEKYFAYNMRNVYGQCIN